MNQLVIYQPLHELIPRSGPVEYSFFGTLHILSVDHLPLFHPLPVPSTIGMVSGVVWEVTDPFLAEGAEELFVIVFLVNFLQKGSIFFPESLFNSSIEVKTIIGEFS